MLHAWQYVLVGTLGVIAGTVIGQRLLIKIPEKVFRRVVAAIILALGIALLVDPSL